MLTLYFVFILIFSFRISNGHYERPDRPEEKIAGAYGDTRRILRGVDITDTRPYMVYLRAVPSKGHSAQIDPNWLCGGVIIHPRYILTSAACIEDVGHFYVVSGTHKWLPISETNECISNGATRAVWKCVPKTYRYDGGLYNNIRWMVNDIAVVMVENEFSFTRRVKGCDFIPKSIAYNNRSEDWEKPGLEGFIAGWGSTEKFTDVMELITRTNVNSPVLMETEVRIIRKSTCKSLWVKRYHSIIDNYMICGENLPMAAPDAACDGQVECRELIYSEEEIPLRRRRNHLSKRILLRSLAKLKRRRKQKKSARKSGEKKKYGGFCENDHGGPLIIGYGRTSVVVGIISAYRNLNNSEACVGPFLYASVWGNRHLINCALYKEMTENTRACTRLLRMSGAILDEEHIDWSQHDKKSHARRQVKKENVVRSNVTTLEPVKLNDTDTAPVVL